MTNPLGPLLLDDQIVTAERLEDAYQRQILYGGQLDTVLLEMGLVDEKALDGILPRAFGLPLAKRAQISGVSTQVLRLLPKRLVERYRIVPLWVEKRHLHIACAMTVELDVLDDVGFMLSLYLVPHVTSELRIHYALERHYDIPMPARFTHLLAQLGEEEESEAASPDEGTTWVVDEPAKIGEAPQPEPEVVSSTDSSEGWVAMPIADTGIELPEIGFTQPATAISTLLTSTSGEAETETKGELPSEPAARLVARLRAEEAEDTAKMEQRRQRVTWGVDDAAAELALAQTRDEVVEVVLRFAYRDLARVALFILLGDEFVGWEAIGEDIESTIGRMRIPTRTSSAINIVYQTKAHTLGPLSPEDPLRQLMGGQEPRAAVLFPFFVRGRFMGVLYGDRGVRPVAPATVASLQIITNKISGTLEHILLQQKRQRAHELAQRALQQASRALPGEPEALAPLPPPPVVVSPSGAEPPADQSIQVEVTPVEVTPVEVAPVEVAPVEVAPVEVAPVEVAPVEVAPVEVTPVEVALETDASAEVETPPVAAAAQTTPVEVAVETPPVEVVTRPIEIEVEPPEVEVEVAGETPVEAAAEMHPEAVPAAEHSAEDVPNPIAGDIRDELQVEEEEIQDEIVQISVKPTAVAQVPVEEPPPQPSSDQPPPLPPPLPRKSTGEHPPVVREPAVDDGWSRGADLGESSVPPTTISRKNPLDALLTVDESETEQRSDKDEACLPEQPQRPAATDDYGLLDPEILEPQERRPMVTKKPKPGAGEYQRLYPQNATDVIGALAGKGITTDLKEAPPESRIEPELAPLEKSTPAEKPAAQPSELLQKAPAEQISELDIVEEAVADRVLTAADFQRAVLSEKIALDLAEKLSTGRRSQQAENLLDAAEGFVEGHPKRREAVSHLTALGHLALPSLSQRFPGKLSTNLFGNMDKRPHAKEVSAVCEALLVFGPAYATPVVVAALRSPDRVVRIAGLMLLEEMKIPIAANALCSCLLDSEPRIALLAADVCTNKGRISLPAAVSQYLQDRLFAEDHAMAGYAIRAMRACRDRRAIPQLVEIVGGPRDLGEPALEALREITKQDFGLSGRKWRNWAKEFGQQRRTEWMLAGLGHKNREMRQMAQQELNFLTGEYFGYYFDSPKGEREQALERWRTWWESASQREDLP